MGKDYWGQKLDDLKIRRRKFYGTRHTFITEMVKRGRNLKAIADYCGTSVQVIEQDYCGKLDLNPTVFTPQPSKLAELLASPTGFEPVLPA